MKLIKTIKRVSSYDPFSFWVSVLAIVIAVMALVVR